MMATLPLVMTGMTGPAGATGVDGLVGIRPLQPARANPAVRIRSAAVRAMRITVPCGDCWGARRRPLRGRRLAPVSSPIPRKSSGLPTSIGKPRDLRTALDRHEPVHLRAPAHLCTRSTAGSRSGEFRQQVALTSHAAVALAREAGDAGENRQPH